jgi:hypothetical protein
MERVRRQINGLRKQVVDLKQHRIPELEAAQRLQAELASRQQTSTSQRGGQPPAAAPSTSGQEGVDQLTEARYEIARSLVEAHRQLAQREADISRLQRDLDVLTQMKQEAETYEDASIRVGLGFLIDGQPCDIVQIGSE